MRILRKAFGVGGNRIECSQDIFIHKQMYHVMATTRTAIVVVPIEEWLLTWPNYKLNL